MNGWGLFVYHKSTKRFSQVLHVFFHSKNNVHNFVKTTLGFLNCWHCFTVQHRQLHSKLTTTETLDRSKCLHRTLRKVKHCGFTYEFNCKLLIYCMCIHCKLEQSKNNNKKIMRMTMFLEPSNFSDKAFKFFQSLLFFYFYI